MVVILMTVGATACGGDAAPKFQGSCGVTSGEDQAGRGEQRDAPDDELDLR